MRTCLMVMNPRDLPEAKEAFEALAIDQAWFRGFREWELAPEIFAYVARTDYDAYILASDDLVPTQASLDVVLAGLGRYQAFTGWCNMRPGSSRANIRTKPVAFSRTYFMATHLFPSLASLTRRLKEFTFEDPVSWPRGDFRVYSTGFAFTGMWRELWLRFPLVLADGSDYLLSDALERAGVEVWSNEKAYFYHLAAKQGFIVGTEEPKVLEVKLETSRA